MTTTQTPLVRKIGVYLSWAVWSAAVGVSFFAHVSFLYVLGLLLFGFAPYLVALQIVEPWLAKRALAKATNTHAG